MNIWSDFPWSESTLALLREGTARHFFALSNPASAKDDNAETAHILFGQPDPALLKSADGPLRWVHVTSAGFTRYDTEDVRQALRERGVILTNSSSVFDEPCAQHLAAMLLALARTLPQAVDNQRGARKWPRYAQRRGGRHLLNGQTVMIYGFGAIARRLTEILRPLGVQLVGVRRAIQGDEGIPMLTEQEADRRLGEADHILNILPENGSTRGFFGAERFARCKPGARFYNVGRGATVDQDALLAALRDGQLESAYLDVTDPEPLPPEHPLWDEPGCFITPHVAGAHVGEDERLAQHFLDNLRAFETGQPLRDRIV